MWRTTADRKGYGDTDEEWSRAYRRNGAVRLTITLPDGATKVMHAPDPTPRAWFDDFLATILPVELLPQDYIRDVVLGETIWSPMNSSCTASPAAENMPVLQNPTESRMST